jgi:transcriptional regulator with PAS, ATPase and Fis domain
VRELFHETAAKANLKPLEVSLTQEKSVAGTISTPENREVFTDKDFNKQMNDYVKELIVWAIEKTGGNKTRAAQILGINRTTLLYKMKELRIE